MFTHRCACALTHTPTHKMECRPWRLVGSPSVVSGLLPACWRRRVVAPGTTPGPRPGTRTPTLQQHGFVLEWTADWPDRFDVGCDILVQCLRVSHPLHWVSSASKSPGLGPPGGARVTGPGAGPGQHGPQPGHGASKSSESLYLGLAFPRRASCPGRHWQLPCASESQD